MLVMVGPVPVGSESSLGPVVMRASWPAGLGIRRHAGVRDSKAIMLTWIVLEHQCFLIA
jgi:hypothetical protein